MVVREEKRGSRMSGEGLGLDLGRVRKYKMILRVLDIEGVEAAGTCSSWSEARSEDISQTHVVGCMTIASYKQFALSSQISAAKICSGGERLKEGSASAWLNAV